MLGVIMILSFVIPLMGALAIRRYAWIGVWAGLAAMVAVPVLYKLATNTYDPMGWGYVLVLVFWPAALGSLLGGAVSAIRRARAGPGELTALNIGWAILLSGASVGLGLMFALDF